MNYGYQNSEELAPGKQRGKFGLNTGVTITKFEYNPNGGKDGSAQDALDVTVLVQETEYRHRFFPVTKAWLKGGGENTNVNSSEYKASLAAEHAQLEATLADYVKCFVEEEVLKQALSTPINSFANYARILQGLVQGVPNWNSKPLDVFLRYQWKPTGDNTRTFLTLPSNVKQGIFICPSLGEGYKEDRTSSHLRYVNDAGDIHPFKRGEWYLKSAFANPVDLGESPAAPNMSGGGEVNWGTV